jgi:succinate dehydrogenase assembly factor 2
MGDASNKEMKSRRDGTEDDPVARREQQLWDMARPRYDAIMARHIQLPIEQISSTANGGNEDNDTNRTSSVHADANRRKRLIYRAKQRGWLEVDLLLGTWASMHVPLLSTDQLNEFENFVNMETIDIYNVLTLRSDIPDEMKSNSSSNDGSGSSSSGGGRTVVEQIQDWVKESPLGKADQEKYHEVKTKNNLI